MARIVPIDELRPRLADIGRIRSGYSVETKKARGNGSYMKPVDSRTWVLTAQEPDNLEVLAGVYGGRVEAWSEERTDDKYRLITESERLDVILPDQALSTPAYERWEGGFIRRRCDGRVCIGYPKDGSEPVTVDCRCVEIDDPRYLCRPKVHLSVLLPQTPIGVWRLTTSSTNAIAELQASAEIIRAAGHVGLPRAVLTRQDRTSGEKEYRVPVLTTAHTWDQLEEAARQAAEVGRATAVGIGSAAPPALALPAGAGQRAASVEFGSDEPDEEGPAPYSSDDDVVDAEIVEDEEEVPAQKATRKARRRQGGRSKDPAADAAQDGPASQRGNTAVRAGLARTVLSLEPGPAQELVEELTAAGLYPIESIPDERAEEARQITVQFIDRQAKEAGQ